MRALVYLVPLLLEITALVHFVRHRTSSYYWLWIIIATGPIGSAIYIAIEILPELHVASLPFRRWDRRKKIRHLELLVEENPAAGNYEELAELLVEDHNFAGARECYSHALRSRPDMPQPFYGRALCAMQLGDFAAAAEDLEKALSFDRNHDIGRALGLLAHCRARTGQAVEADRLFQKALATSVLSETQFNYACFLAEQGRVGEARQWAETILKKRHTIAKHLRPFERPWFDRAARLLKQLPSSTAAPARTAAATSGS